jgi:hypothetical protein
LRFAPAFLSGVLPLGAMATATPLSTLRPDDEGDGFALTREEEDEIVREAEEDEAHPVDAIPWEVAVPPAPAVKRAG